MLAIDWFLTPLVKPVEFVTFHYGYDIADLIIEWAAFDVEIRR
jgi:hypothetical protein